LSTDAVAVEPYNPGFQLDPYPTLARRRAESPLSRMRHPIIGDCWLAVRYPVVKRLLSDPRLVKPMERGDEDSLNSPPPVHTRLRKLVQAAFTHRRMADLQPRMRELAVGLVAGFADRGGADLVQELAYPLPLAVMSEMMGVPPAEIPEVRTATAPFLSPGAGPAGRATALAATQEYIVRLVERKRAVPGEDLTSALIAARDGADRLSEDELVRMLITMLVNGYVTTTIMIANAAYALLDNPAQLFALRRRPELLTAAVEEALRYEPALGAVTWQLAEDIDDPEFRMRAGDYLVTSFQGANRDPAVFADPDRFDITRDPNPHLAFSRGIHHCLGATLARYETQAALEALLTLPDPRLAADVRWSDDYAVRMLEALPIAFTPSRPR
jgi:cytochrome P450